MRNCKKIKNNWRGIGTLAAIKTTVVIAVVVYGGVPTPARRALPATPIIARAPTVEIAVHITTSAATARQMRFVAKLHYIII